MENRRELIAKVLMLRERGNLSLSYFRKKKDEKKPVRQMI